MIVFGGGVERASSLCSLEPIEYLKPIEVDMRKLNTTIKYRHITYDLSAIIVCFNVDINMAPGGHMFKRYWVLCVKIC